MDGIDISRLIEENKNDTNDCTRPILQTIKSSVVLFLIFLFVLSDVFIYNILEKIDSKYVDGRIPTPKGIYVQGIILVIMFVFMDFLISNNLI